MSNRLTDVPNVGDMIPNLYPYCGGDKKTDYHCRDLNLMFYRAVNSSNDEIGKRNPAGISFV